MYPFHDKTNTFAEFYTSKLSKKYCLRVTEEISIYKKLIENSELNDKKCSPGTLETLAQFSILSRLTSPDNSSIYSKMRVYDGESLKDTDPKAKSFQEYQVLFELPLLACKLLYKS